MWGLFKRLNDFRQDRQGAVAFLFAFSALPVLALAGAAVDYSRAGRVQVKLQNALDAATLSASAQAGGKTNAQIEADARAIFAAQFTMTPAPSLTVTVSSGTVEMTGTMNVTTSLIAIAGINSIPVSATARSAYSTVRVRLALALDNTGSMAFFGKMDALKTATNNLLTQLQNSAKGPEDVYVSIVPFARVVNVGTANQNASWLRISDVTTCILWFCSVSWDGAVQDRDQPFDIQNAAPNGNPKLFPPVTAAAGGGTPTQLMGLSNNWTSLRAKVSAMFTTGATNQVIGLAWAWQTLTPGAPMHPPALDSSYTYQQVIVLVSDGQNTQSRHSLVPSTIDARQRQLCDNIKAEGIVIYAIQVNTDGLPKSTAMEYCASGSDKFMMMTDPNRLSGAFSQIGANLSRLRLAR